jgi:hypothetical protein
MANDEQLAILRQGVEAWNAWREAHILEFARTESYRFRERMQREAKVHGTERA